MADGGVPLPAGSGEADLGKLEQEERELEADPEHARMNAALPYVEGSLTYEIYLDDRFGKPELD